MNLRHDVQEKATCNMYSPPLPSTLPQPLPPETNSRYSDTSSVMKLSTLNQGALLPLFQGDSSRPPRLAPPVPLTVTLTPL